MVELDTWAGLEPAVMDIKTVSGLAQVFELTLTDSAGSAVELDGVTFRGAVNTAPLREFACSVEGGKVLFGWSGLPAGRHSFDLYMVTGNVERALLRGAMVVSGRTMPPLEQESYSVNDAATLVFPDAVDGTILIELSEVGLVDLLNRRTGGFAEEGKKHLESIRELKELIDGKVSGFGEVVDAAITGITEAGTAAAGAVEAGRTEAVNAVSSEKAGALAAVKEAGEKAITGITEAGTAAAGAVEAGRTEAVNAVSSEKDEAMKKISPLVERVETAKEEIDKAESRVNTAVINAGQSAQTASDAATAAQQALEAIPQVDEAGNMTISGGLTATGTVNANGGINIPLAAGAATDTTAVSRAYALGMAHAAMMHQTRTYWVTSSCTATNGVAINHIAPGCYCESILAANSRTSVTLPSAGAVGGGNYSKIGGYSLPIKFSGGSNGSAFKISMLIGGSGQFKEYPDVDIDDFRFRPVAGSAADITRLIDVTLYYDNGYKACVRELIGIGIPKRYVVRTTLSNLDYNSNTNPCSATYKIVIAQSEIGHGDALAAGVWLVMGGLSNDTIIKLADIRCWDTYHVLYAPVIYLDAQAGLYGGVISAESPTIINGVGGNTYVRYGLEPYQKSWITSVTEEPYTDPEQPTA
ncbi:hypothetical protein [Akkermansia sp.]|uniref:hypothetical protein n=1 Tax=Akkermansia sp. TaxID=1872421 RepID=UPI003AAA626D